ncbi:MAG: hypothetical protein JNL39_19675 [Opitutaceae bacterium]|nr:hypothetical protein [Opitutaceae bacterium]
MSRTARIFRVIWLLGGCALLLGLAREPILGLLPAPRELPRLDGATGRPWVDDTFVRVGAYQQIAAGRLPPRIQSVSSWHGTDAWQGRAESAWFKASRWLIHVGVAGYPRVAGCRVWAEFRDAEGRITTVDCPLVDPREEWSDWEISRPAGAVAVRIVAEDRTSEQTGWVAFSHPFRAWPGAITAAWQHAQVWCTLALALTLVWGPGLLWLARRRHASALDAAGLIGAGPLLLAALGVLTWALGPWLPPREVGFALAALLWAAIGWRGRRGHFTRPLEGAFGRTLAVTSLVVVAVVARSFHSAGPEGELFRGTVSRNFEMADRIDSRFSFYTVQAAAQRWAPLAAETDRFFAPWNFLSRGPLAGLASIPIVLATGGRPPAELPEARWTPFDAGGFAAYRITMIVLGSSVVMALFQILAALIGSSWAAIGAGLLALSPFGAHELMFTWPKWAATAWVVVSFGLAHARRPGAGGIALGVGFLFHPLALLWAPWLGLWAAGRAEERVWQRLRAGATLALGVAALAAPWMIAGALAPRSELTPVAGQGNFLAYFVRADWQAATGETWWRTRWMNFANTFVPLHGYLADASFNHPKLNSAYEASGRLVKFSQLWWNSLPFALGLGLWLASMASLARGLRAARAATLLLVIGPALFVTAYWGMDPLGLMRECGHPLLVALIGVVCFIGATHGGTAARLLRNRAWPWLQLPETWLMLWLTTLFNPRPWAADFAQLDVVCFAMCTSALIGAAVISAAGRADGP